MFEGASSPGNRSKLNCGLVRDRGTVRTSATSSTCADLRMPTNSEIVRVEWPIVNASGALDVGKLHAHLVDKQRLDVGDGAAAHLLVDGADQPLLHFLVQAFAEHSERLWRRDDRERIEIVAEHTVLQLVRRILDPAILFLLLEVRLFVSRPSVAKALLHQTGRVRLNVPVLALVLARVMRFRAKVDLIFVAVIAEEQHL